MNLAVWGWNFMMQPNIVRRKQKVQLQFAGLPECVSFLQMNN